MDENHLEVSSLFKTTLISYTKSIVYSEISVYNIKESLVKFIQNS